MGKGQERANPVAEAIRKISCTKSCSTCDHYREENEGGQALNWCYLNDTSMGKDDVCDEWKEC